MHEFPIEVDFVEFGHQIGKREIERDQHTRTGKDTGDHDSLNKGPDLVEIEPQRDRDVTSCRFHNTYLPAGAGL